MFCKHLFCKERFFFVCIFFFRYKNDEKREMVGKIFQKILDISSLKPKDICKYGICNSTKSSSEIRGLDF